MKISIITTLFYSANYIYKFVSRTTSALNNIGVADYEIILVNDGSPDNSLDLVIELQKTNEKILIIDLSRNFGHHKAIFAGLENSSGDYVFLIDCDLEEDPLLLIDFWDEMQKKTTDVDVIYGIQNKRKGNFFEKITGRFFYKFLNFFLNINYPADSLTARLMSRKYVDAVIKHKEKSIDLWGIFVLSGFKQIAMPSVKLSKGTTTYTLKRKISIAIETITSLSYKPLYLIFLIGLIIFVLSCFYILYIIYLHLFYDMSAISGWSSLIASVWFIGGLTILLLGIMSIYLSKLFIEVKNRPLYIIKKIYKNNNV